MLSNKDALKPEKIGHVLVISGNDIQKRRGAQPLLSRTALHNPKRDQILVLEGGEIVERGTHEALLEAGGRYRQLYDKQYSLERDQFINPGENFTPALPKPLRNRPPGLTNL